MSLRAHPASSRSHRRVSVAIALLATCLNLGQARAQSSAEIETALNSPDYKEFIRKALQEYGLGNWTEARVFFSRAHAIAPNARTLRGLALVSYESRRYVETLSYAEQAFANPIQPLTPQMQSDLRRFVEQARSFVARARIVSDPAGAELRIDGQPVVRAEDGAILLDTGEHELVATASGYEPHTRALKVQGGTEVRFDIALTPQPVAAATPPSEPILASATTPEPSATKPNGSIVPWIVIGAAAAVAIAGGVMLGIASSDKSKVENVKPGTSWSEIRDSYERAPNLFAVGWVMAGVGVAGIATGLTWKFWLEPRADHPATAQLNVTPTGLQLSGAF